jgi:hypothetical protein
MEPGDETAPGGGDPSLVPDGWTQVTQRHHDPEAGEELTVAIVLAVAEVEGVAPMDLEPPLYDFVDVAALDEAFFGSDATGTSRRGVGTVEFEYGAHLVKVRSDGWIQVFEPAEDGQS